MLKKNKYTISFLGWMMFVTWSSLFSFSDSDLPRINIPHFDKFVHFAFYFVGAILMVLFFHERKRNVISFERALWTSLFTMVLFGMIIEVLQYKLTADRMGDGYDALANSLGAITGTLVMKYIFFAKSWLNWK